jgi:hypothetical protein
MDSTKPLWTASKSISGEEQDPMRELRYSTSSQHHSLASMLKITCLATPFSHLRLVLSHLLLLHAPGSRRQSAIREVFQWPLHSRHNMPGIWGTRMARRHNRDLPPNPTLVIFASISLQFLILPCSNYPEMTKGISNSSDGKLMDACYANRDHERLLPRFLIPVSTTYHPC